MGKIIKLLPLLFCVMATGCHNNYSDDGSVDERQKEFILSKVNNYQGMIQLYRDKLNRREDPGVRYKLAELYYQVEDYESSRHYLSPLLADNPDEKTLILESKNLLESGELLDALAAIRQALKLDPKSGEAHNIQGILLAQTGDYPAALQAFKEARSRFVSDNIVLNNMAMLAILQENYAAARDYLMPLYTRGDTSQKTLHNLVFALVKLQDFQGAENILRQDKMYQNRSGILESLVTLAPRPQQQLQRHYNRAALKETPSATEPVVTESHRQRPPVSISASLKEDSQITLPDGKTEVTKKSVVSENAVLSVTGNLREISAIRSGQHTNHFRITLESAYAVNYRELESTQKNKRVFELDNIKLNDFLLRMGKTIALRNSDVKKVNFYQKNDVTVMMEIDFNKEITRTKTFRIAKSGKNQERLVFDLYHG